MAKFKYNGNHPDMTAFGLVFRVSGENQPAETDDPHIVGKLRGNSHFEEVGEVKKGPGRPAKTK